MQYTLDSEGNKSWECEGHFGDGETVRIRETDEIVTVERWWVAKNMPSWEVQYNIKEHPATFFTESELDRVW
ncbi:hypothetical protein HYD27_19775 [Paenibacillus sp. S150]|nr:hypothetical protein [Paenibacillus sp. S150]